MFYITNQTNKIIAADTDFLDAVGIATLDELTKKIILMDIRIHQTSDVSIEIILAEEILHFQTSIIPLSSVLGDIHLTQLSIKENKVIEKVSQKEVEKEKIVVEEETVAPIEEAIIQTPTQTLPSIEEMVHTEPIVLNVSKISQEIGISEDDYNIFLNEYIDTAISLESDLQSTNKTKYNTANETLQQLADVLQLPHVNEILDSYSYDTPQSSIIESYYDTLSRFTVENTSEKETVPEVSPVEKISEKTVEKVPEKKSTKKFWKKNKKNKKKEAVEAKNVDLDLNTVKAVDFDFNIDDIATSLALPTKLVEEFIHDFIEQAKVENVKIIEGFKHNDVQSIHQTANLLQDASKNLQLHTLSSSLEEMQASKNIPEIKTTIHKYWSYFLSLESQIKLYKQQKDI